MLIPGRVTPSRRPDRIPSALQRGPAAPGHSATRPRRTARPPRHRDRPRHQTDPPKIRPERPNQRIHASRLMPRDPQVTGRILFSGGTGSQLASGRQTYPSGPRDLHTTRCPSGRRRTDRRIDRDLDLHNRTGSDRPALAARLAHRRRQSPGRGHPPRAPRSRRRLLAGMGS